MECVNLTLQLILALNPSLVGEEVYEEEEEECEEEGYYSNGEVRVRVRFKARMLVFGCGLGVV